jgi:hypothetical protein
VTLSVEPEIRASWTRRVLRAAEDLPEGIGPAVRARIPAALLTRLEQAGPLAWLPGEVHANVIQGVHDEIGDERYADMVRATTLDGLNRPLFGPLARGAVGLFGRSAAGLERMFPRGWGLVSRGCGRLEMKEGKKGHAVMQLVEVPPVLRRLAYALGFKGAFDACSDFVGSNGRCAMDARGLEEGRVTYALDWTE